MPLLEDPSPLVRIRVVEAVRLLKLDEYADRLVPLLEDDEVAVADQAVYTLIQLRARRVGGSGPGDQGCERHHGSSEDEPILRTDSVLHVDSPFPAPEPDVGSHVETRQETRKPAAWSGIFGLPLLQTATCPILRGERAAQRTYSQSEGCHARRSSRWPRRCPDFGWT